jgi:NADH-quinone oxidoreductase subunit A
MFQIYLPLLFLFILALVIGGAQFLLGHYLGRRPLSEEQALPYECGNDTTGAQGLKLDVKFYLTAILFVVFDIEVVFIYPWAALFKDLGWAGFATMSAFITALAVALAYCWKKGALEWES